MSKRCLDLPERNKDDAVDNIELLKDTSHTWSCELHRKQTVIFSQPAKKNLTMYEHSLMNLL